MKYEFQNDFLQFKNIIISQIILFSKTIKILFNFKSHLAHVLHLQK